MPLKLQSMLRKSEQRKKMCTKFNNMSTINHRFLFSRIIIVII